MKIAVYLEGNSWGEVGPEALLSGLGGRESAAVYLSECFGDMGHEVHVFCPHETTKMYPRENGGSTTYVHHEMGVPMISSFPYDAILSWESPDIFLVPGVRENCKALVCGMQVAHFTSDEEAVAAPDCWVALSPWHAKFMESQAPGVMRRVEVMPNCVDLTKFEKRDPLQPVGKHKQFVYTSSPDRGLIHVLEAWPALREEFPGAVLHVAYGIENWSESVFWGHSQVSEMAVNVTRLLEQDGVIYHGRIGHAEVAALHGVSDALLYPCDTLAPTETGCITVIEACAGGNIPIITDCDCLKTEFSGVAEIVPLPWNEETYVRRVKSVLSDPEKIQRLREDGRAFAEQRQWPVVATQWISLFDELKGTSC